MSGFGGRRGDEDELVELRLTRQIVEAEFQGKDLSGFLVDEFNCFMVDEEGNFFLNE